jgi:hypothetical protein
MKLSRHLRYWILASVIFALLGIQLIESTHHHESAAIHDACAVCQIVAHTPLDLAPPLATLLATVLFLLFSLPDKQKKFQFARAYYASYHSRAPPRFTA